VGLLLILVGGGWAVLGAANVLMGASKGLSETTIAFSLILNMLVFLMPGLVLAGIGGLLRRRRPLIAGGPKAS